MRLAALIGLLAGIATVASPGAAFAQGSTCSNYLSSSWWDGFENNNDYSAIGITADIYSASDQVCDSDPATKNQNTAQVTVFNGAVDTFAGAGIVRSYGAATYGFADELPLGGSFTIHYTSSSIADGVHLFGAIDPYQPTPQPNETVYVTPRLRSGGYSGSILVSASQITMCCYDTVDYSPHEPMKDRFWSGATYLNSDVPGVPSTHILMRNMAWYDDIIQYIAESDPYPCVLSAINNNTSHWTHSADGCDSVDMWTYLESP
jgi:uncharacterized membrane protein